MAWLPAGKNSESWGVMPTVREEAWGHSPAPNGRSPQRFRDQPRGSHGQTFLVFLGCCLCHPLSVPHALLRLLFDLLCYPILSPSSQFFLYSVLCHKGVREEKLVRVRRDALWGMILTILSIARKLSRFVFTHCHFSMSGERALVVGPYLGTVD